MAAVLTDHLEAATRRRWEWGAWDCTCGLVTGWVVANGHPDPVDLYRGRYRTALGCERLVRREGGMVALLSKGSAYAGLHPTDDIRRGSVAAVEVAAVLNGRLRPVTCSAICLGERWAMITPKGLTVTVARPLAVWGV